MYMSPIVYFALYRAIDKYNTGKKCKIVLSDDWDNGYAGVYIGYTQQDYSYEEAEVVAEEILYAAKLANTITSMDIRIIDGDYDYSLNALNSPEARQISKDILDVLNMGNTREFRRYISQLANDIR